MTHAASANLDTCLSVTEPGVCFRLSWTAVHSGSAPPAVPGPGAAGWGHERAARPVWGAAVVADHTPECGLADGGAAAADASPGQSQCGQPADGDAPGRRSKQRIWSTASLRYKTQMRSQLFIAICELKWRSN